jgi:hypothetical protein
LRGAVSVKRRLPLAFVAAPACLPDRRAGDYPPWQNVYYHYRKWKQKRDDGSSLLDEILAELVMAERLNNGREPEPTMSIVDSKSVKNAFTAEEKGYDGGKKYRE